MEPKRADADNPPDPGQRRSAPAGDQIVVPPAGGRTVEGAVRRRSNLLVLLGIAFFLVGGVIVYLVTSGEDDGDVAGEAASAVVVGTEDISPGSLGSDLIAQGKLEVVEVPSDRLVAGAVQSLQQLEGATFTQGFAEDQQVTTAGIQGSARTFQIPEGFEAVAVQLDFVSGGAGYVNAGDRVNLYGLLRTNGGELPTPRTELLLGNVEVLDVNLTIPARRGQASNSVDAAAQPSARASGDNVTYLLALTPADAEKVIYATEFEGLYASLTRDGAPVAGDTPGRDSGSILE